MINDALLGHGTFVRNDEKLLKNQFGSKVSPRGASRVESPESGMKEICLLSNGVEPLEICEGHEDFVVLLSLSLSMSLHAD